jgi:hypothetical protein
MEGKAPLSPDAQKAGREAMASGSSVNQGLLDALAAYKDDCFELAKAGE